MADAKRNDNGLTIDDDTGGLLVRTRRLAESPQEMYPGKPDDWYKVPDVIKGESYRLKEKRKAGLLKEPVVPMTSE